MLTQFLAGNFSPDSQLRIFATVLGLTFLAELPARTSFAAVILATRQRAIPVFLGAALAFLVHSAIAVAFGSILGFLPEKSVRIGSGCLFLILAVALWFEGKGETESDRENQRNMSFAQALWLSFAAIFMAEWGDLTQISTITLSAKYKMPYLVFIGALLGLWGATVFSVTLGAHVKTRIKARMLRLIATAAFALLGISILCGFKI